MPQPPNRTAVASALAAHGCAVLAGCGGCVSRNNAHPLATSDVADVAAQTTDMNSSITRHVLQLEGLHFEFLLNEQTGGHSYVFPTFEQLLRSREYCEQLRARVFNWRNRIVSEWSVRTGKSVLLVGAHGELTSINGARIETL